jgi:hypothetical protein
MGEYRITLMIACLLLAGCTSDPGVAANRVFPIPQMDQFFNSLSGSPGNQDYTHEPGYAPAYPSY